MANEFVSVDNLDANNAFTLLGASLYPIYLEFKRWKGGFIGYEKNSPSKKIFVVVIDSIRCNISSKLRSVLL